MNLAGCPGSTAALQAGRGGKGKGKGKGKGPPGHPPRVLAARRPDWRQQRAEQQAAAAEAEWAEAEAIGAARARAMRPIRLCVFQYCKRAGGPAEAVQLLERELADRGPAELAAFPEFFANSDDPWRPDQPEHRFTAGMAGACAQHRVYAVYSGSTVQGGRARNCCVLVGPAGRVEASCDKKHLDGNGLGCGFFRVDCELGRLGGIICADIEHPDTASQVLDGAGSRHGCTLVLNPVFINDEIRLRQIADGSATPDSADRDPRAELTANLDRWQTACMGFDDDYAKHAVDGPTAIVRCDNATPRDFGEFMASSCVLTPRYTIYAPAPRELCFRVTLEPQDFTPLGQPPARRSTDRLNLGNRFSVWELSMARRPHGSVRCVASVGVGDSISWLAAGFEKNAVQLWSVRGPRFGPSWTARLDGPASGLALSPEHLLAISGSTVTVFAVGSDLDRPLCRHRLDGPSGAACWSESGRCFYIAQGCSVLSLQPPAAPEPVALLPAELCCLSEAQCRLTVADVNGEVWCVEPPADPVALGSGSAPIQAVACHQRLLLCDGLGLHFADQPMQAVPATGLARISASGKLFVAPDGESVSVWRVEEELVRCCGIRSNNGEVVAVTGCSDHLLIGCRDGSVLMAHFTQNTNPAKSLDSVFIN